MKFYRPTVAEIDLGAIRYNLRRIREIIGKGPRILGVVKADAYGHGMKEVARAVAGKDVEYLGVSSLDEARELREAGIKSKIIVLGTILPGESEGVLRFNVIQAVSDLEIAKALSKIARVKNRSIKVHLKIDTGMGRIGFWHEEAVGFIRKVALLENIVIDGIFTHFPSAENDRPFTNKEIRDFNCLVERLRHYNINIPLRHTSNSMALIGFRDAHMDMVRPGLIMYGLYPKKDLMKSLKLKPALEFRTKVIHVKSVSKGRSISYGRTHTVKKNTKIATIPVGYGDGYSRHLSNRGRVLVKGKRAPIVGRVCMDMCMIDVGHLANVCLGDEVILIGTQGREIIRAEELAGLTDTIPYEVVCNIGRRVPRVYKGGVG